MKKRFALIISAVCMVLLCSIFSIGLLGGSTTAEAATQKVVYINNEADWINLSKECRNNKYQLIEHTVYLQTDIYFDRVDETSSSTNYSLEFFNGKFYGNNHSLVGFKLSSVQNTTNYCGAVFGTVYSGSVIQDLNIVDADISCKTENTSYGVSLVAQKNYGTIQNVRASGQITSKAIAAGLVQNNAGTIKDCVVVADILINGYLKTEGTKIRVIGSDTVETENVISSPYVGSIVTFNMISKSSQITNGTIENTYASVKVKRHSSTFSGVTPVYEDYTQNDGLNYYAPLMNGGVDIAGGNYTAPSGNYLKAYMGEYKIENYFDFVWLQKNYNLNSTKAKLMNSVNLFNCSLDAKTISYVKGSDFDFNNMSFYGTSGEEDLYSVNIGSVSSASPTYGKITLSGSGTEADPYKISSASDLLAIAESANSAYITSGVYLKLTKDISLIESNVANFKTIASFGAVLDGGGYSISGIVGTGSLFGLNTGTIKNLFVQGKLTASASNKGLLVAENQGALQNIEMCAYLGNTSSSGLVGINNGTIADCTIRTCGTGYAAVAAYVGADATALSICNTRSYSALPYVGDVQEDRMFAIYEGYTESEKWLVEEVENDTWVGASVQYYNGEYEYFFENTQSFYEYAMANTTSFGITELGGWAYEYGEEADIPTLVFASDRIKYKTVDSFEIDNASYTYNPNKSYSIDTTEASLTALRLIFGYVPSDATGIQIEWEKYDDKNTAWVSFTSAISNVGRYKVLVTLPSSIAVKGGYAEAELTISKADMEFTSEDFFSISGVTSFAFDTDASNAVDYTTSGYALSSIVPAGVPTGVTTVATISGFHGYIQSVTPTAIKDAGEYVLKFVATGDNYNKYEADVYFTVNRLKLTITPQLTFTTLEFGSDIEGGSRAVTYGYNNNGTSGSLLIGEDKSVVDLSAITYETDYVKGTTPVGTVCKITAKEVSGKYATNNYYIDGASAEFTITKASIDSTNVVFKSATIVYDGKSHTPAVSGVPDGVTATLYYLDKGSYVAAEGKYFIDVKSYGFKLVLSAGGNYADKEFTGVTVTITPKQLNITGKTYRIIYGDDAPTYEVDEYSLYERADGLPSTTGINGSLVASCSYAKGSNASDTPYNINWSGMSGTNYSVICTPGKLYVGKAEREITLTNTTMDYTRYATGSLKKYSPEYSPTDFAIKSETYYLIGEDESATLLTGAPVDSGKYRLILVTQEDTNYQSCEFIYSFTIIKKNLEGITLVLDGAVDCLGGDYGGVQTTYNGSSHKVDIYGTLPTQEDFDITYYFGEQASDSPFEFTNVNISGGELTGYKGLKVVINGNPNYAELTLYSKELVIAPAELTVATMADMKYTSGVLVPTITFNGTIYNEDVVDYTYSATKSGVTSNIQKVGTYTIKVISKNDNYNITGTATLTVVESVVQIDWSKIDDISIEYGVATKAFEYSLTFVLENVSLTKKVKIDTNVQSTQADTFILGINTYSIVDVPYENKYAVTSDDSGFIFASLNGTNKITVTPKTLSFDIKGIMKTEASYDGTALFESKTVPEDKISGLFRKTDVVSIVLTADREVINAGDYTLTAKLQGTSASKYKLAESCKTFTFKVKPIAINVSVSSQEITYGAEAGAFSAVVSGQPKDYTVKLIFSCDYYVGAPVGNYPITAAIDDINYVANCTSGVLSVKPATITGVTFDSQSFTYTGEEVSLKFIIPDGASYSFDAVPTEAGTHKVKLTVSMGNYYDLEKTATITIKPAKPTLTVTAFSVEFTGKRDFTDEDFEGKFVATFNGKPISGTLVVEGDGKLLPGEREYSVHFVPESSNLTDSRTEKITINAIVDTQQFEIEFLNCGNYNGTINPNISGARYPTITIKNYQDFGDSVVLYVNGEPTSLGSYIFTEDQEMAVVEIKYEGMLVFSTTFGVSLEYKGPEDGKPVDALDGEDEENPSNKKDETSKKTGLSKGAIIGIACGGAAVVVIVIVIVIVLIKRRGGGATSYMPSQPARSQTPARRIQPSQRNLPRR